MRLTHGCTRLRLRLTHRCARLRLRFAHGYARLRLARFRSAALDWKIEEPLEGYAALVPTDHTSFQLHFLPVEEPKVGKNRIHLDLTSTSLEDQPDLVD